MPPLSLEKTLYLFYHIVLPPKLPQESDWKAEYEDALLNTTVEALQTFGETVQNEQPEVASQINLVASSINNLRPIRNKSGFVSDSQLAKLLHGLASSKTSVTVPIEIKAQNAAVIISKQKAGTHVLFEVFELSPPNETVMQTKGRLKRSFPTFACHIPLQQFQEKGLIKALAETIGRMSWEEAPGFQPQIRKNKSDHNEIRDTTHPGMITDFLMHFLSVVGQPIEVQGVWKNTREDVLLNRDLLPWRRSSLWLLVRITMQLQLARTSSGNLYKAIMVTLLVRLLESMMAHYESTDSDLLYIISAKLTGRLQKLRKLIPGSSFDLYTKSAQTLLEEARLRMTARIDRLMNSVDNDIDMAVLTNLQPRNELDIHLPQIDEFIAKIFRRARQSDVSDFQPSSKCLVYLQHELPTNFRGAGEYTYFYLATVEKWVEDHLSSWVERRISDDTTCEQLQRLLKEYFQQASSAYSAASDMPRSLSIMYLTVMELWIACDKCACNMYPLLRDFNPEVELSSFHSLSLPFKSQLERLLDAEAYVERRRNDARAGSPSLYRKFGHPSSFAVRFFDGSSEHHTLLSNLEQRATKARQEKCLELAQKKQQYHELIAASENRDCDYWEVWDEYHGSSSTEHAPGCKKCSLLSQAEQLQIHVHEWPFNSNEAIAKATVFELQIPKAYSHWRDATMFLQVEVLGFVHNEPTEPRAKYELNRQDGLSSLWDSPSDRRINLVSEVKPLTGSHYRIKKDIAFLQESDVCVENALRYRYFDSSHNTFINILNSTQQVSERCTYKLPVRSSQLQAYLRTPVTPNDITPNQVIARLSDCPPHFSLDEYKAFASIPIGYGIQYQNILVQLAMPTVDLNKIETQCLLLQTIHRAGPPRAIGNTIPERAAHEILTGEAFCRALTNKIEAALRRISENWETWRAVATLVQITLRILSINASNRIASRCIELLEEARLISLNWLTRLKKRLPTVIDDSQRKELSARLTEIGLLCTSTFDTDGKFLEDMLCSRSSTVSVLLQASIVVQENKDVTSSEHMYLHRAMLQSWKLLLHRALPVLARNVSSDNVQDDLSQAVAASWATFRPTSRWSVLEKPRHHWVYVKCGVQAVHLNLLTAELLVNGRPLSRLPAQYTQHHQYASLFDKLPIEVTSTDEPGMEFSAMHPFHPDWCYNLHFGMEGSDMLVLAARDGTKFDVVPSRVFKGQLPAMFVDDYFHWYDHNTEEVEFRPLDDPWASTSGLWRLKRYGANWRLESGDRCLIGPSSSTGRTISNILSPLELQSYTHIIFESSSVICVELPRRRLGFRYVPGDSRIYSHQYKGMVIDTDQRIGTLSGLATILILKYEQGVENRLALIPEGDVTYSTTKMGHVSVSVNLDTARTTHAYQVDEILGRMIDNGSLQSKLFLCYLHALTSHCLPDTLTGHTGTEAALSILRSGAAASFDVLTAANIALLKAIAQLTPARKFYPHDKEVMQEVHWDQNLPSMSQHPDFLTAVHELFSISSKTKLLHPNDTYVDSPKLDFVNLHLLKRDMIRTSKFRVDGFGAEHYTHDFDQRYKVRAKVVDSQRGPRSSIAAGLIFCNQATLHSSVSAHSLQNSLRTVHLHNATVQGLNTRLDPRTLRYDASWLEKPSSFLPDMWCNLHLMLSTTPDRLNKFDLMIWLSTAAFAESADMDVIQALAAFYNCRDLASIEIPSAPSFNLAKGDYPTLSAVQDLVRIYQPYEACPESDLPRLPGEPNGQRNKRRRKAFETNRGKAARTFASALYGQWPCEVPTTPRTEFAETYLDTGKAMPRVRRMFKSWYDNRCFYQYLQNVSDTLARQIVDCVGTKDIHVVDVQEHSGEINEFSFYGIKDVFKLEATDSCLPMSPPPLQIPTEEQTMDEGSHQARTRLMSLFQKLRVNAKSSREKEYISELDRSCKSLALQETRFQISADISKRDLLVLLERYLEDRRRLFDDMTSLLQRFVQSGDEFAAKICQSPRICPIFWLRQLNRDCFDMLTENWKQVVIRYGLAVTELHRARRLLALSSHPQEFAEELRNRGHQNWDPMEFPETLLLEAESGLLVREVQEEIAKQMRCPPNYANSVMQLNMGEGKSSVIVQIIAAFLAQGDFEKRLVRVIVAKSQSRQMFQMLVSKLGGLLNRRIYHMPFSRALKLSSSEADAIGEIYQECRANRGILLVQTEHILSFKLMGIECLLNGQADVGKSLLRTQRFFDTYSRDIVDESDENFSVKFELVYTMGTQLPIQLSPERWTIIHSVLGLVTRYAADVKKMFPSSIEFDNRVSGYPRTRILRGDAEEKLLDLISEHICEVGISGLLSIARQPPEIRQTILRYIRQSTLAQADVDEVETGPFFTEGNKVPLLLLRGLIAGGVLSFTLKSKRWRVNYGLDPSRKPKTQLAVPYRSKDSPSPRSEFSHPDVVITLTSLTYYYGGLNDQDLFDTFAHLEKSDQSDVEYEIWVRSAGALPEAFQHLTGINIKDRHQCTTEIFPLLRYSKGAIDYFLSHIVFPKAMKEFPSKLSASGWDLGAIKSHPTTGFSGTNDSRQVLPLSVRYLDSEKQNHTNALVLAYLLQDENSVKLLPPQTDAERLLKIVDTMELPNRVILDAGAQILELSNLQVAETWLRISNTTVTKAKAVIFFNDNEELSVLDHNNCVELLQTSPFSKHLDECLVYLDQAHTRGTDLKLPTDYRAAVTLGANLTKDTLVQACMRMRKLGKGQSVVFCIPEEIQTKILECTSKSYSTEIEVSDLLAWAITETWADMRRNMSLWATQGRRYEVHKDYLNGEETTIEQAKKFLEPEAQSLEDRYRPRLRSRFDEMKDWDTTNSAIQEILKRYRAFEAVSLDAATLQEEQERELSPEIEEERQVQRPAPMEAEKHKLYPDLVKLVNTGILSAKSPAFIPAFQALKSTSAATHFDLAQFPNGLLVTADFMRTVKRPRGVMSDSYVSDSYLRPVQWILSVVTEDEPSANPCLIILSPFEAEQLVSRIKKSDLVTLHLYSPRHTQSYNPLDTLDLYCVGRQFSANTPSLLRSQIAQLNLFAGQLYFKSHTEYVELCRYLGLAWEAPKEGEELQVDGFIVPLAGVWGLNKSPVRFLRDYVKTRREGEGLEKTHLGKVLEGGLLEKREIDSE
ncbi:DUF3638 containing protein [Pyrenophora tritici-repentis]|nr:DUF3638 containing protein [Pyrenophora tritici-repentis]KAI1688718.1 DUF3638 containing protein [Pyrenophora tritici-repentis]